MFTYEFIGYPTDQPSPCRITRKSFAGAVPREADLVVGPSCKGCCCLWLFEEVEQLQLLSVYRCLEDECELMPERVSLKQFRSQLDLSLAGTF